MNNAVEVRKFHLGYFNHYLNYHRPCGFATITIDDKGKRKRKYEIYQTPYERFKSLKNATEYLKPGLNFKKLDDIAMKHNDNEFAKIMQEAKDKLFRNVLHKDWIKTIKRREMIQKNVLESKS